MPEHVKVSRPQQKDNSSSTSNRSQQTPLMRGSHPTATIQRAMISPQSLTYTDVIQLQRTIGNRAVGQLMQEIGLMNSQPVLRKESDLGNDTGFMSSDVPVQRVEIPEEEEEKGLPIQGKFEAAQREELLENKDEEPLQMKKENNTGMPDQLKAGRPLRFLLFDTTFNLG
jgi:hypothetical protein